MRDQNTTESMQSSMPTAPTRPLEEIVHQGDEIYDRDIRSQVEDDHPGEVVATDVDISSWAIGVDVNSATDRLRTQRPEAIDVWSVRVGHRVLGGRQFHRLPGQRHPAQRVVDARPPDRVG